MSNRFAKMKELRTYTKFHRKNKNVVNIEADNNNEEEKIPLTTQNAVKYLLEGTLRLRVCRYCLNVTSALSELDEVLAIAVNGSLHEVTIRSMVASFHPFKVNEDTDFPNKICKSCLNHTIECYLFAQKCEQAERALRNCFDDIYEKFDKLDPLEPVKKRGKRKRNPNHNVLYTEHKEVIKYAEPIINIVNVGSSSLSDKEISDLECQKCWQMLPDTESLLNHEKSHPKSMWYSCKLCGKSFVKRFHLKRHIKETHLFESEVDHPNPEHFKCKECSHLSNTLGEHLQHVEKHKFKTMFEHLIERKVDNLCSVCLESGSRLTNLSEIISFYGGYPDLIGDKPIQSILNTTIPESNPNKYKELLIPQQATIVRFLKKDSKKSRVTLSYNKHDQQGKKFPFEFSYPVRNEEANVQFNIDLNLYTFAKPLLLNPFEYRNQIMVEICNSSSDENIFPMTEIDTVQNKILSQTKEDSPPDIPSASDMRSVNDIVQSCKVCWIFNKPTCKHCLNETEAVNNNPASSYKKNIFIKSVNCYYCNKNQESLRTDKVSEKCESCWIFNKVGKCDVCKLIVLNTTLNQIDRQNLKVIVNEKEKATETIKQNHSWQCSICLTNNINRYACICCDKNNECVPVNVTFKPNMFKDELKCKMDDEIIKGGENIENIELFKIKLNNWFQKVSPVNIINKTDSEVKNSYIDNRISIKESTNVLNEDLQMDIDMAPNISNCQSNEEEAMDVEENETQCVMFQENTFQNVPNCIKPIKFHMGNIITNTQRFKRPLRRMATRFQK